jgi:ABC-type dipeptide/oligopeptide/nickel transport system permease subunit
VRPSGSRGLGALALVIGLLVRARPARVVRAAVIGQAGRDHVLATRCLGAG